VSTPPASASAIAVDEPVAGGANAFRIAVPNFEGPLELLLHLIREHKLDIFDIPIALVTEKYLAHLESMRKIDLDVAGEFLVMAATLLQLKSRLLLPKEESTAEAATTVEALIDSGDPRADLVRRLLEYQKYKHAAEALAQNDLLERDVFVRRVPVDAIPLDDSEVGFKEVSVYKLIESLDAVLQNLNPRFTHEVVREHLSLSEAMRAVSSRVLSANNSTGVFFEALFASHKNRGEVVITFLAILEMCKLKLLTVSQESADAPLSIAATGALLDFDRGQPTMTVSKEPDSDYR
jgi:segregation and condensation protein A